MVVNRMCVLSVIYMFSFVSGNPPQSLVFQGPVGVVHTGSGDAYGKNMDLTSGNVITRLFAQEK